MKAGHSLLLIFFPTCPTKKKKIVFISLKNLCSCNVLLVRNK